MRSYSESREPQLAVPGGARGGAHSRQYRRWPGRSGCLAQGASPQRGRRARPRARAPRLEIACERHSSTPWPTSVPVEEARLGCAASRPWKASAARTWASRSAWRSKSITGKLARSQLLQERPVVGHPELLPACRGELRVALAALTGPPLERLPNRDRVSDHPDRPRVEVAPQLEEEQRCGGPSPRSSRRESRPGSRRACGSRSRLQARRSGGAPTRSRRCASRIALWSWLSSRISRLPRALKRARSDTGPSSTPCSWIIPATAEVPLRCMPEHRDEGLLAQAAASGHVAGTWWRADR